MSDQPRMQPQDAFEELATIALADHSLQSVMAKVADLTKRSVPGISEASVTFVERGEPRTVAYTGALALHLDERQYERGYGPCLDSIAANQPVRIDSMTTEQRWPDYAREAATHGAGSSLTVPVPVQREIFAAINTYSTDDHAFDDAAQELVGTFAAYAGVALANMHLYEAQAAVAAQLQQAMESRAVIEQAKGVLMGRQRCSAEDAFGLLVGLSQRSNRKLRDVARALVDEATKAGSA